MTTYDIISELCKKRNLAVTALERELGFGRGSIGKLRTGNTTLERLQKIADYFGVSVNYLTTVSYTHLIHALSRLLLSVLLQMPSFRGMDGCCVLLPSHHMVSPSGNSSIYLTQGRVLSYTVLLRFCSQGLRRVPTTSLVTASCCSWQNAPASRILL